MSGGGHDGCQDKIGGDCKEEDWEKELRELLELEPEEVQAQIQFDARHQINEHDAEESVVTEKLGKDRPVKNR